MNNRICLLLIAVSLVFSSCSESWLDVNDNPNSPEDVTPELIFPAAVVSVTNQVTVRYNIAGGMWAQFWTQNPTSNQYKQFDAYDVVNTTLTDEWDELYSGTLKELRVVEEKAVAKEEWRLNLMATVVEAYTWQLLADLYDEVPYFEALKADEGILYPHFDGGAAIYDDLIARLDAALDKDFSKTSFELKSDFIFKGDPQKWIKLANTLKLKIYLRQWYARPGVAQAGIQKLIDDGAEFLTEDAKIDVFVDAKGKGNPLFESDQRELNTTNNIRGSYTFISWLAASSDPRVDFYFKPGSSGQLGNRQGDFNIPVTAAQANVYSLARINATDPVYMISLAESYFLQAEAFFRLSDNVKAKQYYDLGVKASFARCGMADAADAFIAAGGAYEFTAGKELENIITQKWASLCGINGMEAYLEHLRTGFPVRTATDAYDDAYIPGQFTHPVQSVLPKGSFVKRLVIPDIEKNRNPNTPAEKPTTTPVWWNE